MGSDAMGQTEADIDYLRAAAGQAGLAVGEDDEECFLEQVGKHVSDGKPIGEARALAFCNWRADDRRRSKT